MRVRKEIGYLLLVVIGIGSIVASLGAVWMYVMAKPIVDDQKLEAELFRLQAAAMVYRESLGSFEGVCRDIGLRAGYECNWTPQSFAVAVERSNGNFYCADSTGHMGEQLLPLRKNALCSP